MTEKGYSTNSTALKRIVSSIPLPANILSQTGKAYLVLDIKPTLVTKNAPYQNPQKPSNTCPDNDLLELWQKIQSKIDHFGITSYQITRWFEATYKTHVNLIDFDLLKPPVKLTRERLAHFYKAIERYATV